jgi:hypothetical protein
MSQWQRIHKYKMRKVYNQLKINTVVSQYMEHWTVNPIILYSHFYTCRPSKNSQLFHKNWRQFRCRKTHSIPNQAACVMSLLTDFLKRKTWKFAVDTSENVKVLFFTIWTVCDGFLTLLSMKILILKVW